MFGIDQEYRGITRALQVLSALNSMNGSSVTAISRMTGISRPALYRILSALVSAGYIRRRESDRLFFLTSQVKTLSVGFSEESWISEIARPVLDRLQREIIWPTDLAIYRGNRLQILETTRSSSPLAIHRNTASSSLPSVLNSALGLAYIAFQREAEQEAILVSCTSHPDSSEMARASDPATIRSLMVDIRGRGFASSLCYPAAQTGSIAVPVRRDGVSVASIGITFIASVLTSDEVAALHLNALRQAADEIEERLISSSWTASTGPPPVSPASECREGARNVAPRKMEYLADR